MAESNIQRLLTISYNIHNKEEAYIKAYKNKHVMVEPLKIVSWRVTFRFF